MQRSDTGFRGPIAPPVKLNAATGQSPITTTAYTTLIASTPSAVGGLLLVNTTGSTLIVAIGQSGFEIDLVIFGNSGTLQDILNWEIPKGSRIALKAVDTTTTAGWVCASFFQ